MEDPFNSGKGEYEKSSLIVTSAMRAIDVLECIASNGRPLSVREVAKQCGISRPTAYRYLISLSTRGYITNYKDGTYDLGSRVLTLGRNFMERYDWISLVEAKLNDLSQLSGETVHIALLDKSEMLYLVKVDSSQSIRMHSTIGTRNPLYSTAMGKAVLAFLDAPKRDALLDGIELLPRTPNTITVKKQLYKEFKQIASNGYAIDDIENELGVRCVSSPIFDFKGGVIGAISISGPSYRLEIAKLKELAPIVISVAKEISTLIGSVPKNTLKTTKKG